MSDTEAHERITIYSDYVCPFCYLGRQALDRYQAEREEPLEIDWRPFDLRAGKRGPDGEIDHSVDDGKDDDYYQQARENVRRLRENYGAEMAQEIATDVDSRPAQAVSLHVKETEPYETWLAFDEAVFEALWADGRDIGSADVLVDCAEAAGLDSSVVSAALDDGGEEPRSSDSEEPRSSDSEGRGPSGSRSPADDSPTQSGDTVLDRLDDQFDAARRQGVTGVPTFAYGGHAARGAVPPAQLRRLVEGT